MFKRDNPVINDYAQESAVNLRRVVVMVALSIKQPWYHVGQQMKDYDSVGLRSRYLWGNKGLTAYWLAGDNLTSLYGDAIRYKDDPVELMNVFLQVPGIGLAKAGFCCQLFAGSVGCIDTINVGKFGIKPFTYNKKAKEGTRRRKIQEYVDFCKVRRSEALWNLWCRTVAITYPDKFEDANHVSRVHVDYLQLGENNG